MAFKDDIFQNAISKQIKSHRVYDNNNSEWFWVDSKANMLNISQNFNKLLIRG